MTIATVPSMRNSYPSSPPLSAWAPPSNAADEELRAQAVDVLRAYSPRQDAAQLVAILDRLRLMCERDLGPGNRISGSALPHVDPDELTPLSRVVKGHVLEVYKAMGGNKTRAARVLEIDIKTLYNKLKRYGVR